MEEGQAVGTLLPLDENDGDRRRRGSELTHAAEVAFESRLAAKRRGPAPSSTPEPSPEDRSLDGLRAAVARQAAASAEILEWVACCADERVFREFGFRSESDWLSTELRVSAGTARMWVFLSRRLRELPTIREAYRSGDLTWDQLRLLCGFVSPEEDAEWAERGATMYPAQLWREMQRRLSPRLKEERSAHASRYLSLMWDEDDPVLYGQFRLGKEQGAALEEAIRERAREIPPDPGADDPSEARSADALVELCTSGGDAKTATKPQLVTHVDVDVLKRTAPKDAPWLCETERGHRLHPETARRLGCDADVEWVLEQDGRPIGVGRKSPRVPAWLERAVRHRDGATCRFPGCERRISLLSHHIRHWADGGGTDLGNLVTLCGTHHRYVHEDGWRIAGNPNGELRFHDPTGRALARASPPAPAA